VTVVHSPHNQISFTAAENIAPWLRVKINPTPATGLPTVSIADADDANWIGLLVPTPYTDQSTTGNVGTAVTVRLNSGGGTFNGIASKAIARGAELYAAAGGKISDTGTLVLNAIALNSVSADGDLIEYILKT
jgi:hypothetical protein